MKLLLLALSVILLTSCGKQIWQVKSMDNQIFYTDKIKRDNNCVTFKYQGKVRIVCGAKVTKIKY